MIKPQTVNVMPINCKCTPQTQKPAAWVIDLEQSSPQLLTFEENDLLSPINVYDFQVCTQIIKPWNVEEALKNVEQPDFKLSPRLNTSMDADSIMTASNSNQEKSNISMIKDPYSAFTILYSQ